MPRPNGQLGRLVERRPDPARVDLLGTPVDGRDGRQPGDIVGIDGRVIEPSPGPLEVARRAIADLHERRSVVADLDETDRALVSADQYDESNTELKKLRRYENTLHSRLHWYMKQLHDPRLTRRPTSTSSPSGKSA